jgi:hypothetical protein
MISQNLRAVLSIESQRLLLVRIYYQPVPCLAFHLYHNSLNLNMVEIDLKSKKYTGFGIPQADAMVKLLPGIP